MGKNTIYEPVPGMDPMDFAMPGVRWFQFEDMRHYVRDCADNMGLRDWTVQYATDRPSEIDSDVLAAIEREARRMDFEIWLSPMWFTQAQGDDKDKREARATVAHELLHVKFVRIDRFIDNLYTNLGEQSHGLLKSFYLDEMEQFIDDLAYVVAESLPLPNIPTQMPLQRKIKPRGAAIRSAQV